jgi:hypothetical protein
MLSDKKHMPAIIACMESVRHVPIPCLKAIDYTKPAIIGYASVPSHSSSNIVLESLLELVRNYSQSYRVLVVQRIQAPCHGLVIALHFMLDTLLLFPCVVTGSGGPQQGASGDLESR